MTFTGSVGTVRTMAGNVVAGFGSTSVRNGLTITASMTAKAGITSIHTYVFTIVSITIYRAVSRTKNFISIFRTS